jgi:diaminopimelate epimerase
MRFTKMHGAGNDYVYVDCFRQAAPADPAEVARRVSDRHFGVGGDGLVLILPSEVADARMRMFNADGSEAEMCGNAVRCVAKYVYDHGLAQKPTLKVETGRGVLSLDLEVGGGRVERVRVDMGEPILAADQIPTTLQAKRTAFPGRREPPFQAVLDDAVVDAELPVGGRKLKVTCVSMGNPHCVTYVPTLSDYWVLRIGPKVETDPHFPRRVNAEFVEVISREEVRMRVWERGSGETMACGTGAGAVCVAGAISDRTDRKVLVHLRGGDLELHWAEDNHVYLTGPAVEVFFGEYTA